MSDEGKDRHSGTNIGKNRTPLLNAQPVSQRLFSAGLEVMGTSLGGGERLVVPWSLGARAFNQMPKEDKSNEQ